MPAGKLVKISTGKRTTKQVANLALREVRKLKKSQELKYFDTDDTSTVSATWAVVGSDYLDMAQGDTSNTRDGDKINLRSIHLKGSYTPSTTLDVSQMIRLALYWVPDNVALAQPAPFTDSSVNAFRDVAYTGLVRVLWDRVFIVSPKVDNQATPIDLSYKKVYFDKNIKLSKILSYNSDVSSVPLDGKLVLMHMCDAVGGGTASSLAVRIRVRYTDS